MAIAYHSVYKQILGFQSSPVISSPVISDTPMNEETVLSASYTVMLAETTVLCCNMLLCCMYHNLLCRKFGSGIICQDLA